MHQKEIPSLSGDNQSENGPFKSSLDFSTMTAPERDQFPAFRSLHRGVMDVSISPTGPQSFPARQTVWTLDRIAFMRTKLPGKKRVHRQNHLHACTLDHWYVSLPFRSRNGGQRRDAENPVPLIHCLAAPFDRHINHDGLLSLFIPQGLLPATAALDRMPDAEVQGVPGRLLAEFMFLLNESVPHLHATQVPYLMEATRNLVAACLDASPGRMIEASAPIDATLLARARRLIEVRLAALDFNSETVCTTLGVSRSRLYRVFQPFGGVVCYIRKQRLLRTRNALSNPADTRSISRIAEQWGFTDASAYSRAFRHEFGISPREARDRAWTANGYSLAQRCPDRPSGGQTLHDLLRTLS